VLKVPRSDVDDPPNVFEEGELNYVTGVGKLNGRLIILIELGKVLQRGELKRLGDLAEAAQSAANAGS
jgi:purine-binding chemotaxis protein CheW